MDTYLQCWGSKLPWIPASSVGAASCHGYLPPMLEQQVAMDTYRQCRSSDMSWIPTSNVGAASCRGYLPLLLGQQFVLTTCFCLLGQHVSMKIYLYCWDSKWPWIHMYLPLLFGKQAFIVMEARCHKGLPPLLWHKVSIETHQHCWSSKLS